MVRLMGVDLTPDDPYYQTEWHVEGQMVSVSVKIVYIDIEMMELTSSDISKE